jgi:hypothetical protein
LKEKVFLSIKILWFVACAWILWDLFSHSNDFRNQEAIIGFVRVMIAITFPVGYAVWALFSIKSMIIPGALFSIEVEMIIRWICFVFAGYFQWFFVLPKVLSFLKRAIPGEGNKNLKNNH